MKRDNELAILLTGIGIGAAVGLLLARSSGKDLRKGIQKRVEDASDYVKEQGESLMDKVETAAESVQDRFGSKVAKGKGAMRDLTNKAKDLEKAAEAATSAAVEMADSARVLARRAGKIISQQA